jgi:hypothetical protein
MTRASEATEQGEQTLIDGVRPITLADRLTVLAAQPMRPKRNPNAYQKSCDHGLFDEVSRAQLDLTDLIKD